MAQQKKEKFEVPGTIVKCQSGRFLAFYEHRTDIVASGENETDAKKNLKKMFGIVKKHEEAEQEKKTVVLPKSYQTKEFKEKLSSI